MRVYDRKAIQKLREGLGLNRAEFGRRLNMTRQQVTLLEEGMSKPNVKTLERLMAAFGVDETHFFYSET